MKKLYLLMIILALTILSGCEEKETITMMVPYGSPSLATLYVQINDHYKVDVVIGAQPLVAAFSAKTHDVIIAPTQLGAKFYHSNAKYKLAATLVWGNFYLASLTDPLTSIESLEGKHIVVFGQNQTSDIILNFILSYYNIEVNLTYVDSVSAATAILLTRDDSIVMMAEPSLSLVKASKDELHILDLQVEYEKIEGTASFPQASVFVKDDLADNLKRRVLDDIKISLESVNTDLETSAQLAIQLGFDMTIDVLINAILNSHLKFVPAMDAKVSIIRYYELILLRNPLLIGNALPNDSFYLE
jgi:NitT/TauT family transport system substrate-binding protein